MRNRCLTALGVAFSNFSLCLFSSVVSASFLSGLTIEVGSRLKAMTSYKVSWCIRKGWNNLLIPIEIPFCTGGHLKVCSPGIEHSIGLLFPGVDVVGSCTPNGPNKYRWDFLQFCPRCRRHNLTFYITIIYLPFLRNFINYLLIYLHQGYLEEEHSSRKSLKYCKNGWRRKSYRNSMLSNIKKLARWFSNMKSQLFWQHQWRICA